MYVTTLEAKEIDISLFSYLVLHNSSPSCATFNIPFVTKSLLCSFGLYSFCYKDVMF